MEGRKRLLFGFDDEKEEEGEGDCSLGLMGILLSP
jgi:hypothetical protein